MTRLRAEYPFLFRRLNADPYLPVPGAVEFAEEYRLPGPQQWPAAADDYSFRTAGEGGFYMRGGVPFHVRVTVGERDEFIQFHDDVPPDIGIGVFIYRHCGGSMGDEDHAGSFGNAAVTDSFHHQPVDVHHLRAGGSFH